MTVQKGGWDYLDTGIIHGQDSSGNAEAISSTGGAAHIYTPATEAVVTTESRRIFSLTTAAATDAVIIGAATPTVANGTDLVEWNGFTNSPVRIKAKSYGENVAASLLGWLFVVNTGSAAAAGAAINAAMNATGVGIALATPVNGDSDASIYFVPLRGGSEFKFSATITDVYIAPCSVDATPAVMTAYCHMEFLP